MSAKRYREYADECMGSAKTAKSDKDRRSYLQMAETWLKAAAKFEKARRAGRVPSAPQITQDPSAGRHGHG